MPHIIRLRKYAQLRIHNQIQVEDFKWIETYCTLTIKQQINLANYCGGKKILLPPPPPRSFIIAGASVPIAPRGSDAYDQGCYRGVYFWPTLYDVSITQRKLRKFHVQDSLETNQSRRCSVAHCRRGKFQSISCVYTSNEAVYQNQHPIEVRYRLSDCYHEFAL